MPNSSAVYKSMARHVAAVSAAAGLAVLHVRGAVAPDVFRLLLSARVKWEGSLSAQEG